MNQLWPEIQSEYVNQKGYESHAGFVNHPWLEIQRKHVNHYKIEDRYLYVNHEMYENHMCIVKLGSFIAAQLLFFTRTAFFYRNSLLFDWKIVF